MNPPEPGQPRTPGTGWSQASDSRAGDSGGPVGAGDPGGSDAGAGRVGASGAGASGAGASGAGAGRVGTSGVGAGRFGAGGAGAEEVGVIRVSADPASEADIIESGPAAAALSWRRSTVAWAVIVALVVGGAAGYLLGVRHAGAPAASSVSPSTGPAVPAPPRQPALAGTGNRCAIQLGKRLQLGVEVVNGTAAAAVIDRVTVDLPLNGLREVDSAWGTCGQLTTVPPRGHRLEAGASGWLSVTFDVLVPCPAPLPVGFVVAYERGGQPDRTEVWGFSDLGEVSYAGCPTG